MSYLQKDGYYTILNKITNKALNIDSFSFEPDSELGQSNITGLNNEIFYFEKQNDGSFLIMASHSGLFLENVENPKTGDSTIKQRERTNLQHQNFYFNEVTPGFYTIKAKDAPLFLTIKDVSAESICMAPYDEKNIDLQLFSLTSTTRNKILIPSGYYSITNENSKKVLDIHSFNFGESPLMQDVWNGGNNQIFYFEMKDDNSCTIRAAHSDMYLQAATTDGLTINQYPPTYKDDQIFYLEEDTPGVFYLKSKVLNRVLGPLNASKENGVKIIQYIKKDDDNQRFKLKRLLKNPINHPNVAFIKNGFYKIQNFNNKKFLTIKDFSISNKAEVTLSNDDNTNNQIFYFEYLSSSIFLIKAAHSNLYLTIDDNTLVQSNHIQGSLNQQFYVELYKDKYRLKAVHSNKVLDILNTKICQLDQNYTDSQIFNLIPAPKNPSIDSLDTMRNQVVSIAKDYLGTPYAWGGSSPTGFDCSGFVQYVYKQIDITISRTTYSQIKEGVNVLNNDLKLGDLIFFGNIEPSHVGIYIGSSQYIHAPQSGDVVKISKLGSYLTARRIIY